MCHSIDSGVCCVSICVCVVCVCVISNQRTSKKPHYVSDLIKLDVFLDKTHKKVLLILKYQGTTCADP